MGVMASPLSGSGCAHGGSKAPTGRADTQGVATRRPVLSVTGLSRQQPHRKENSPSPGPSLALVSMMLQQVDPEAS